MGKADATDYFKKLAAQNVVKIPTSARQVLDQVMAGEYAIGLHMQAHHAAASAAQGAPLRWLPIEHALVIVSTVSIAKGAPHPNAAKLLVDYLVSLEGQAIYRDADYVPAHPGVAVRDPKMIPKDENYRSVFFSPEEIDANLQEWNAAYKELMP
jgi:iron(III) transport system substrate-binding protein